MTTKLRFAFVLTALSLFGCDAVPAHAVTRALMENLPDTGNSFYVNTASSYTVIGSSVQASTATLTIGAGGSKNIAAGCIKFPGGFQCAPGVSTGTAITSVTAGYGLSGGGTGPSVTLNLTTNSTSYIQNGTSLQSATFNVSSGTATNFTASQITASSAAVTYQPGTYAQFASSSTTSSKSTTSSVFQTTFLAKSVTPVFSSSKIQICAVGDLNNASLIATNAYWSIFSGTNNLGGTNGFGGVANASIATGSLDVSVSGCVYDTSTITQGVAITYSVKIRSSDNTTAVAYPLTGQATLWITEIAQ